MKNTKFPSYIEIQTTDSCNGRCTICPSQFVARKGVMTDFIFRKIIDEVSIFPDPPRIIPYLNGEPLLDAKICDRLDYIRKKCPLSEIEISTNLSQLNCDHLKTFDRILLDDLRISCFGFSKSSYEKCMQGLKFDTFLKNIELLYNHQKQNMMIKKIEVVMILFEETRHEEIEELKKFCEERNFHFNLWGFLDRSQNVRAYSNNINITPDGNLRECELHRYNERMYILSNGDVVPCCDDWNGKYILGNVKSNTLLDIWNGSLYRHFRSSANGDIANTIPELCSKCKLYIEERK